MSRFKIMALIALFTFALGLALAGDAVAGEKMKGRCNWWTVKWEQIEVGDQEGHVFAIWEGKGIGANKEGKSFHDGWIEWSSSLNDQNLKTGVGTAHGYEIVTDPDGDKIFVSWEARWPNFRTLLIDFIQILAFCVEKPFNFRGCDFNSIK
jgi:hypothetical protein